MEYPNARLRVSKALVRLMRDQPFFASILYAVNHVYTENLAMPTMGVDGFNLYIHPDFAMECSVEELMGVLAHEAMHIVFKHHIRRGAREAKRWNIAGDAVINPIVRDCGLKLPRGGVFIPDLEGRAVEAAYDMLDQNAVDRYFQKAAMSGGLVLDPEQMSEAAANEAEHRLDATVRAAAASAKQAGKLPGALEDLVEAAYEHKVDWRDRFRHSIGTTGIVETTWLRPNRWAMALFDTILPSLRGQGAGHIVIAIDTSGSITQGDATAFLDEINGIVLEAFPALVTIIQCDADIQDVMEVHDTLPTLSIKGRGGTAFQPVIDWVDALPEAPQCLVYMTDLYGPTPSQPKCPVIWLCTSSQVAPFGETVRLERIAA